MKSRKLPRPSLRSVILVAASFAALLCSGIIGSHRPVFAADGTMRISPATASIMPGGTTTVTVEAVAPIAGFGSWTVEVQYDPAVVSATACTGQNSTQCNPAAAVNKVRLFGSSAAGLTGTQSLAQITFQAVGAAGTSSPLTVTVVEALDPNFNTLTPAIQNGSLSISAPPTSRHRAIRRRRRQCRVEPPRPPAPSPHKVGSARR